MSQPESARPLIASGMARQLAAFRSALDAGMPRVGWKIGINDPAAQQRLGLGATLVGWLDGRRVLPQGQPYRPPAGSKPRIEAEVAVRLASDVPAGADLDDARAAIAAVAPAIEFVDAAKPLSPLDALLASDILHDGVLFGSELPLAAASGLVAQGFPAVKLNGAPARNGLPGRYPEDLAEVVAHVANVLAENGEALQAGDRIICGSYIDPFDIVPGDEVVADFGPLGLAAFHVA
ncbi:hypothetical protein [Candidatus Amarobacter glycogenicus]|uniref:hypothetical protein n=1 Tax=Candidatus Amarobacter glycogenicus TaxID=3140699 RepID=UPI002A0AEBE1|nr:hypothetical protein [Dehalococcoidia bacterium]